MARWASCKLMSYASRYVFHSIDGMFTMSDIIYHPNSVSIGSQFPSLYSVQKVHVLSSRTIVICEFNQFKLQYQ